MIPWEETFRCYCQETVNHQSWSEHPTHRLTVVADTQADGLHQALEPELSHQSRAGAGTTARAQPGVRAPAEAPPDLGPGWIPHEARCHHHECRSLGPELKLESGESREITAIPLRCPSSLT